jgi:hypothetical protein
MRADDPASDISLWPRDLAAFSRPTVIRRVCAVKPAHFFVFFILSAGNPRGTAMGAYQKNIPHTTNFLRFASKHLGLMEDAAVYSKARPRAGRPRRIGQVNPELTLVQRNQALEVVEDKSGEVTIMIYEIP